MNLPKAIEIPSRTPYNLTPIPELNRDLAYARSIDSLSRYKFMMFGYWAALWVLFNQMSPTKQDNPFRAFVQLARKLKRGEQ